MHVGLNLVFLVPGETGGMETYARELILRLAARPDLRLTAFVNRETAEGADGPWRQIAHETVPVRARNRLEWVRGEQQHLPRLAERAGCELIHSLASTAPLRGRLVRVTTVHDLNYKLVPEAHFGLLGAGMRVLIPAAARRSRRLIAVSSSTRDDLVRHLSVAIEKIDVVPQGVRRPSKVATTPEGELRRKLDLGRLPLVLSMSAKRPHKNLPRLLQALRRLPANERPMLVIPGYPTPHERELRAIVDERGLAEHVRLPGWLSEPDVEALYAAAACMVFPSLYEGFGLPVLEAMARGLPVGCSDRSSLPEVAGDAALLFDPEDVDAITIAMRRLLGDEDLRRRLRQAGPARASSFTWEATAAGTAATYQRALAERS